MEYPVNECFYSLQGEGVWTGTPMFFIRFAGCNLACAWCDTNHIIKWPMIEKELVKKALAYPARRVCLTGGEPTLHDLYPLTEAIKNKGFKVHLESNGTNPGKGNTYINCDWITISPKSLYSQLNHEMFSFVNEVKFLCGTPNWENYIDTIKPLVLPKTKLWLMPIASPIGINQRNTKLAIDYCLEHPEFSLCLQTQKYLNIR